MLRKGIIRIYILIGIGDCFEEIVLVKGKGYGLGGNAIIEKRRELYLLFNILAIL